MVPQVKQALFPEVDTQGQVVREEGVVKYKIKTAKITPQKLKYKPLCFETWGENQVQKCQSCDWRECPQNYRRHP